MIWIRLKLKIVKKKKLEERMYLLRLKYKRLEIMQEELISDRRNEDEYKIWLSTV